MFKKTLITVAALSTLALGATAADAHGYGNSYGYGYGNDHQYTNSYSYDYMDYSPICYYESQPVTLKIWDDYSYSYTFKTIYRQVKVCY